MVSHLLCNVCALQRFQFGSGSVFQSISLSSRTFKEFTLKPRSVQVFSGEFIGMASLVDKNIGIPRAPSRFRAVVLKRLAQGIGPWDAVHQWQTSKGRKVKVPFDSTLLSPTFVPKPLAYNPPKYIIVHVFPLFHCHVCHDFDKSRFFVLCPWANGPVFRILNVIPIAVPAVRCHPTNSNTDFLPLLTEFLYSPKD